MLKFFSKKYKPVLSVIFMFVLCSLISSAGVPIPQPVSVSDKFKVIDKLTINGFKCLMLEDLNEVVTKTLIVDDGIYESIDIDTIKDKDYFSYSFDVDVEENTYFINGKEYDYRSGYFLSVSNSINESYNSSELIQVSSSDCEKFEIGSFISKSELEEVKDSYIERSNTSDYFAMFIVIAFILFGCAKISLDK